MRHTKKKNEPKKQDSTVMDALLQRLAERASEDNTVTTPETNALRDTADITETAPDVPTHTSEAEVPAETETISRGQEQEQPAQVQDAPVTSIEVTSATTMPGGETDVRFIDEQRDNPYNNVFVESLDTITQDDLGPVPEKKKKDPVDVAIEVVRQAVFWVAIAIFIFSAGQVVFKLVSYRQADELYGQFDDIFETPLGREDLVSTAKKSPQVLSLTPVNGTRTDVGELGNTETGNEYNEQLEMMKGQLSILKRKNEEVIGWIRVEGETEINYPLVQHNDGSDYYLHYAYDGTYNPAGAIYLDYQNNPDIYSNRHTIIGGHNMESGSPMFANLLRYREQSFLAGNRYVDVYTQEALYTYEIFAAYESSPYMRANEYHPWRLNFQYSDEVFMEWVNTLRRRSDITSAKEVTAKDRILTLSTCTNANDMRYVVHAVLVKVVK